jgi:O-antigen/teichoic acid export membrane protein
MLLSLTFIFAALTGGIYAMLRATRQIKYLAQANIFGSVVGLMIALPIFYFYGIKGVVPAIIATSFATYLVSLAFRKNIKFEKAVLTWSQTWNQGKPMVMLGLSLTVISLLTAAVTFVLSGYISKTGSLHDLGLYNAGLSIVDGYVGMVFTAMAADYFPRLSGIIGDEMKWKQLVNEQAELILIILGMVLVLLITTTPILIRVLLSEEFLDAKEFIFWSVLSIPLKGLVWVMGFIVLAKGNNKLFLAVEVIAHLIILASNLIFYSYLGLTGLGISMLVSYFISFLFMLTITKSKYDFGFFREVYRLLVVVLLALSLSLVSIKCLAYPMAYLAEAVIVILTLIFGIRELNNRMNLKEIVVNIKSKISKKKDV